MAEASKYFRDLGVEIMREGRAGGGGSQFHLYVWAPDEQIFELYYGIEQISWNGYARPAPMRHGTPNPPTEPQLPDYELVRADIEKGINVLDGWRYGSPMPLKYNVDGLLLPQPFKITRVGPVNLFVEDYETAKQWYQKIAGFALTEEVEWQGERCAYLRCDNEHHSLALFPKSWREKLGLSEKTANMSFGLQLANYQQLGLLSRSCGKTAYGSRRILFRPSCTRALTMRPTPSTPTGTAWSCTIIWSRWAGTVSRVPKPCAEK